MLSMNSSTSWFCTSRKYSAIVNADSATRIRVPGGSSIWPNTSAVSLITPDSVSSVMRSLPSRVRSPTPANTEVPPKFLATRVIISWMSTVLPTPAPPNRPILPPTTYGVSRSMTLMPVGNISVLLSSSANGGGSRWIDQRSVRSSWSAAISSGSPRVLNTWPRVTSPTGTVMGEPVSVTSEPRTSPSVGCSAMARTMSSPMCCATSRVSFLDSSPSSMSTVSALNRAGIALRPNSTSTTGPMTRTTRPEVTPASLSPVSLSNTVVIRAPSSSSGKRLSGRAAGTPGDACSLVAPCRSERVGAADDLADFLGDFCLPGLVGQPGVGVDQFLGVVAGRLHRAPPCSRLRCRRLEQRGEYPGADVARQQSGNQLFGFGLEFVGNRLVLAGLVVRAVIVCGTGDVLDILDRRNEFGNRNLGDRILEAGEDDVQLVEALPVVLVIGRGKAERHSDGLGCLADVGERGLLGESGPRARDLDPAEVEIRRALTADDIAHDFAPVALELADELVRRPDRVGVVPAGQAAVARDEQDPGTPRILDTSQHRVLQRAVLQHRSKRPRQLLCVRAGSPHPCLRLHDARCRDELHRLGDLARRLDRPYPAA